MTVLPNACAVCDKPMVGHRFQPTPGTFAWHAYRAPSAELKRQRMAARMAAGVKDVADATTPAEKPASPPSDAPCGFCWHPAAGHGVRYDTFGGSHVWRRSEPQSTPWPRRVGDPR